MSLNNIPLVRHAIDGTDDQIYFDPHVCVLDAPTSEPGARYEFVDAGDDIPRALLNPVASSTLAHDGQAAKIQITGTAYPSTTDLEYSLDAENWEPLDTDGYARIDHPGH